MRVPGAVRGRIRPVGEDQRRLDGGRRAKQSQFQAGGGRPEAGAGLPTAYSLQSSAWMRQTKPIPAEEASALIMD